MLSFFGNVDYCVIELLKMSLPMGLRPVMWGNTQRAVVWFRVPADWLTDVSMPLYLFLFPSQQIAVVCEHQGETGCDVRREFSFRLMEDRNKRQRRRERLQQWCRKIHTLQRHSARTHTEMDENIHTNNTDIKYDRRNTCLTV